MRNGQSNSLWEERVRRAFDRFDWMYVWSVLVGLALAAALIELSRTLRSSLWSWYGCSDCGRPWAG